MFMNLFAALVIVLTFAAILRRVQVGPTTVTRPCRCWRPLSGRC
jgi:hypothetical protein